MSAVRSERRCSVQGCNSRPRRHHNPPTGHAKPTSNSQAGASTPRTKSGRRHTFLADRLRRQRDLGRGVARQHHVGWKLGTVGLVLCSRFLQLSPRNPILAAHPETNAPSREDSREGAASIADSPSPPPGFAIAHSSPLPRQIAKDPRCWPPPQEPPPSPPYHDSHGLWEPAGEHAPPEELLPRQP